MNTQGDKKPRWIMRAYRLVRSGLAVLGLVYLLRTTCFELFEVRSMSMSPTLRVHASGQTGDWILCEKVSYWFRDPGRWDVIEFESSDGVEVVKRIAGLPGETMQLADGLVVINGRPVPFPPRLSSLHYFDFGPILSRGKSLKCESGYAYLGDYSRDSQDSRYEGTLAPAEIKGRVWLRIWPLSRFGWVY